MVLPGRRLKKGHIITDLDIRELQAAGVQNLTIAKLEPGDVDENSAASDIANGLCGAKFSVAAAFTGRVNVYAENTGLFTADKSLIDRVNRVSPAITVATLGNETFVETGRMVATVKIIPFAVAQTLVTKVVELLAGQAVLSLASALPLRVGLVATCLPSLKPSTMDKTSRRLSDRLAPAKSEIVVERRVEHQAEAVTEALREVEPDCDLIVIFGASAITDTQDVIPQGIVGAGGDVSDFGMPVDPGNLLLLGSLNGKTVIGAPGCARSPAENGFDWVLHRVLCGKKVDGDYLTGLGVGGLLMEIFARPQPREG